MVVLKTTSSNGIKGSFEINEYEIKVIITPLFKNKNPTVFVQG